MTKKTPKAPTALHKSPVIRAASSLSELKNVAHAQTEELFNVQAILQSTLNAISIGDQLSQESGEIIFRLIHMAKRRVSAIVAEFDPYI